MSIYIYVEGVAEVGALPRILTDIYACRRVRAPVALSGAFLSRIGPAVAKLLAREEDAHTFACPGLAPNKAYLGTKWEYRDCGELQDLLRREVRGQLSARLGARRAAAALRRFHPHPFRHDFEAVVLACPERLKAYLRTTADITKRYRRDPEDQDFEQYPSKVVDALFNHFRHTRYKKGHDPERLFDGFTRPELDALCARCPRFAAFVTDLRETVAALGS
ncbi:MAG: DUF4276 family protein [Planctomycetes bacterium]|nr:DUF4276 family protein [Planctomycetota bacterium]